MRARQVSAPQKSKKRGSAAPGGPPPPEQDGLQGALSVCLRLLSYRMRSHWELRRALERRGVPPHLAAAALERLGELGLVDDQEFASAWVQARMQGKALGSRGLLAGLAKLGVSREIAREVIAAQAPEQDQLAAARQLATARAGGQSLDRKLRARLFRLLVGRGFSYAVADQALRDLERGGEP